MVRKDTRIYSVGRREDKSLNLGKEVPEILTGETGVTRRVVKGRR